MFLTVGNLLLLGYIWIYTLRTENASFTAELRQVGPNVTPTLLAGIGLTGIIFCGAIDLSIGGILVVAGTVFGILYHHQAPPFVCFIACCAVAWGLSYLNGHIIRWLRIPAIIVTLAGLTFYRGCALVLADYCIEDFGGQISILKQEYKTPGEAYATWILVFGLVAAMLLEINGKAPRTWLALGGSPKALRLKGLNEDRVLQSAFAVGGLFLGLGGLAYVTNLSTIEPSRMALGFELQVVGAVVLGGTNIFGGEGSLLGTALGATFLYLIGKAMIYVGISPYWRVAIQGAMIIGVIGLDCALHRSRRLLEELR